MALFSHKITQIAQICLRVAAGEAGNHGNELTRADRFGDVHLIAGVECLPAIDVSRVCSQGGGGCFAAFFARK